MKASFRKYIIAAVLAATAGTMTAQELNSAYYTDGFLYRHDMNPAYGNEQNYASIPVLGNMSIQARGTLGVGDLFYKNPDYGVVPGAKKTATFMHPKISADQVLKNIETGANTLISDIDIPIASVGFSAFNGYNTVELRERSRVAASLPYDFFKFAKDMKNQNYSFDDMGVKGFSYVELALGHSRQIFDNLRVGAKVKMLFGIAYANLDMSNVNANLQGDHWVISGKAHGEVYMKDITFKEKEKEYKSRPGQTYRYINDAEVNSVGMSGFGLGLDLGAVYEFKDCSVEWLDGLKASFSLNDIGFISWSDKNVVESSGKAFEFSGFNNFAVKKSAATESEKTFGQQGDEYSDKLMDFANLRQTEKGGSSSYGLNATLRAGLEYPLPVYDKLKFGFLFTHRFDKQYGWSEGRLSANYAPLKWLDGGINVGFSSFSTEMGWILNIHPTGFNFFVGMDYMMGKTAKSMIPLDSNVCVNIGFNISWGGKKAKERGKNLTF